MILAQVIRAVESSFNPHAIRFEPALYSSNAEWIERQVMPIAAANKCNLATAKVIACSSWGEFQLLGANLYSLGFKADIITFAFDPGDVTTAGKGLQWLYLARFIYPKGYLPGEDVTTWPDSKFLEFAAFYNGPGNPAEYASTMKQKAGLPPLAA